MRILGTDTFLLEKMKIVPLTDDEFSRIPDNINVVPSGVSGLPVYISERKCDKGGNQMKMLIDLSEFPDVISGSNGVSLKKITSYLDGYGLYYAESDELNKTFGYNLKYSKSMCLKEPFHLLNSLTDTFAFSCKTTRKTRLQKITYEISDCFVKTMEYHNVNGITGTDISFMQNNCYMRLVFVFNDDYETPDGKLGFDTACDIITQRIVMFFKQIMDNCIKL